MSIELLGDGEILGALLAGDDGIYGDDLLGDEILGATLLGDDLLGAAPRGISPQLRARMAQIKVQQRMNKLRQLALAKSAGGAAVVNTQPTESRVQLLPFDSVSDVAAAATQTITQQPQQPFRVRRLVVDDNIAPNFLINDIKVGKDSQLLASGAGPATVFMPQAVAIDLKMDTCPAAVSIAVSVTNRSGAGSRFTAFAIGDTVQ